MSGELFSILDLSAQSGTLVGTDETPLVDVSDLTQSAQGSTVRSTWAAIRSALLAGVTGFTATDDIGNVRNAVFSGTVTAATLVGALAASLLTGTVAVAQGGTGFGTATTGDLVYASASNTLAKLSIGSNANVVLTQNAGVPAWSAQPTFSTGQDSDTTVTFGTGGSSPSAGRDVSLNLNAPSSGSFLGGAYITYSRTSSVIWRAGIDANVTGAKSANTDFAWRNGSTYYMALTTGGQLRMSGGFWTTATASLSVSGVEALIGTVTSNPVSLIVNGTQRWQVSASAHFLAFADDSYDIGAAGATRPRSLYIATSAVIGKATSQGTLTTQAADGFAQLVFKNAAGSTGASQYMASGGTTFVLNVNSKLVTVDNTGALTVNATGSLFSAGTDTNTTLQIGAGGGAPTGGRTAALIISTPSDGDGGSNPGNAQIYLSRNGTAKWIPGIYSAAANVMAANTDFTFFNASSVHVASITQAGQYRSAVGFVTKAGAAGSFGTVDNFALNFLVNNATVGNFDTSGNLIINGSSVGSDTGVNVRTTSTNAVRVAYHGQNPNTGTSGGVKFGVAMGDSTGAIVDAGNIQWQKSDVWTNGSAATFDSKLILQILQNNALVSGLIIDGNTSLITHLSGFTLKLGTAAAVSVATASTHKIAVQDNTGTTYYLLASNV